MTLSYPKLEKIVVSSRNTVGPSCFEYVNVATHFAASQEMFEYIIKIVDDLSFKRPEDVTNIEIHRSREDCASVVRKSIEIRFIRKPAVVFKR
jgi:hypothetical protein